MKYIREYLYNFVSHEVSREDWFKDGKGAKFDIAAPGLRSVYSIKVKDGEIGQNGKFRYVPTEGPSTISVKQILKYSIYQPAHCVWNEETRNMISELEPKVEQELKDWKNAKKCKSEYNSVTKKINVGSKDEDVTQELIDKFVSLLPPEYAGEEKWGTCMRRIREAGQLVAGFKPDYFLHQWSRENAPNKIEGGIDM